MTNHDAVSVQLLRNAGLDDIKIDALLSRYTKRHDDLVGIIRHQAALNESAHAEIGRLRHALECAVASMESGVTSLGAIRVARAALNGESNG